MGHGADRQLYLQADMRSRWAEFFAQEGFTHAITLRPHNPKYTISLEHMHRAFVRVHMLVDRKLLGPRFPKKHDQRTAAVGIVEGLPDATHLHGAMRVRPDQWTTFEAMFSDARGAENIWRKVSPAGTCAIDRIEGALGWHDYTLKGMWDANSSDRIMFLPL